MMGVNDDNGEDWEKGKRRWHGVRFFPWACIRFAALVGWGPSCWTPGLWVVVGCTCCRERNGAVLALCAPLLLQLLVLLKPGAVFSVGFIFRSISPRAEPFLLKNAELALCLGPVLPPYLRHCLDLTMSYGHYTAGTYTE